MPTATDFFLETSALVDVEFRNAEMRRHVLAAIPLGAMIRTSHYVIFELARGFLMNLITLHNKAADFKRFSDLTLYVKNRSAFTRYAGSTMLGAFVDFQRHLEKDDAPLTESQRLAHFRAWLGPHIQRGWARVKKRYPLSNPIGCRADLPAPVLQPLPPPQMPREHIRHDIPTDHCGTAGNCDLLPSMHAAADSFRSMERHLQALPEKDAETQRRLVAMPRLLGQKADASFEGKDCHDCGDAIIVHEAGASTTIVTKNGKHIEPLCAAIAHTPLIYREPAVSKNN